MQTEQSLHTVFFKYLFGDAEGYLCISSCNKEKKGWKDNFFLWPKEEKEVDIFIQKSLKTRNIYFCVSLLKAESRKKENCKGGSLVWADLDVQDDVSIIDPTPSCILESSPGRYQAFWRLDKIQAPEVLEDYSRRIGYKYGADKSGWDMGQLLRVPYTHNYKYPTSPLVSVLEIHETRVPIGIFDSMEDTSIMKSLDVDTEMPDIEKLPDVGSVIYAHREYLRTEPGFATLFTQEPPQGEDWSKLLWRLINICLEAGMSQEEAFVVALASKCNKYERDGRPPSHLWREILKASINNDTLTALLTKGTTGLKMPLLVDGDIVEDSLVADYKKWGEEATDAPHEYHELSSFIALSSIVSEGLRIPTSFSSEGMVPNLWGLILGESTLTRKTTAMRMAMDIVTDLENDAILATDGSAEGLLTGLSARPNRVSIFYKDEVSGFFDSINRKDYLAGLPETLTQLYDCPKILQRLLRKETITITEPYFIFFGGGIRDKVYSLVNEEYILSGFIPRFLIVSGENDFSRIRRTGPPTVDSEFNKQKVIDRLMELKEFYSLKSVIEVGGEKMLQPIRYKATLNKAAWAYYGDLEMTLIKAADESPLSMTALPTFQRLSFSMLKMATLIAATRREPDTKKFTLEVTKDDIRQAAFYVQNWGRHSVELLLNSGRPFIEHMLNKVVAFITVNQGCNKSALMNQFHLSSKDAREILETLTERGLIITKKAGRGVRLWPVI